jgi:hypothetical protein
MIKATTYALLLGIIIAGCGLAPRPAQHISIPFYEPTWSSADGTASILGQGFLRTRGGSVRTCAGERVILIPHTPYTAALYQALRTGPVEPDSRLSRYIRTEHCSAQGDFAFQNLPPGRWFIETRVLWEAGGRYSSMQGGTLVGIVETRDGQATKQFLTDEHLR